MEVCCQRASVCYHCRHDFTFENRIVRFLRPRHSRAALKPFSYLYDRLFLVCCSLYALNRWVLKPRIHNAFLHGYFNDVLLIPCALPPLLFMERLLHLRNHDEPPRAGEIALNVVLWSILFEVLGPHITPRTTGDPWDAFAYAVGGTLSWLWWHRSRWSAPSLSDEL